MVQAPPLVVTADPVVRGRLERVAAAAQVPVEVDESIPGIGAWMRACAVLIDVARLMEFAGGLMPRREHLYVVSGRSLTDEEWRACVELGTARVLSADDSDYALVRLLADVAEPVAADGPGAVIAVVGGCGGAGASVLAAAIALVAATRGPTVLADLDSTGAGLAVCLGMERAAGAFWSDISTAHGRLSGAVLRQALPALAGTGGAGRLLGFGPGPADGAEIGVASAVIDAVRRDGGTTVVDLPRHSTGAGDHVITRADLVVVVATADVRGCYASARLVPRLVDLGAGLGLVVRGPSPSGIGPDDLAGALGIPLVAAMPPQGGLARRIDEGGGLGPIRRGPLARAARTVLACDAVRR